jgi:hypothetical protein
MHEDDDEKSVRMFSGSDLTMILTAAFFGLAFLVGFIWVMTSDDPFGIPGAKPAPVEHHQQETPGEVPVTLPPKS